ncbi:hypothetical protein KFE25_002730 [Diacronema lutheri]|uniref:Uncharacterized protein n=1 Tax=Diacronema lutheri TaxID=2081491 RepID=A0A8J5XEG1_DIALT|nr:hypothetical protein KFE25_002730 [Diacronema lutheri]
MSRTSTRCCSSRAPHGQLGSAIRLGSATHSAALCVGAAVRFMRASPDGLLDTVRADTLRAARRSTSTRPSPRQGVALARRVVERGHFGFGCAAQEATARRTLPLSALVASVPDAIMPGRHA